MYIHCNCTYITNTCTIHPLHILLIPHTSHYTPTPHTQDYSPTPHFTLIPHTHLFWRLFRSSSMKVWISFSWMYFSNNLLLLLTKAAIVSSACTPNPIWLCIVRRNLFAISSCGGSVWGCEWVKEGECVSESVKVYICKVWECEGVRVYIWG